MALTEPLPVPPPDDAAGVATVAEDPKLRRSRLVMASGLIVMGVLHFVAPKPFDKIIPRWMPGAPRGWTYASGVAELGSGVLLAIPRTKRIGATMAAATIIGVYPANIQMSIDHPPKDLFGLGLLARLPLQIPMIATALKHARR